MSKIKIKFQGKEIEAEKGTKVSDFLKENMEKVSDVLVVSLNGKGLDLSAPINEGGELKAVTFEDDEGRETYWHSTSHIMAAAVKRLFPETKVTIGPAVSDGFYYDFDREKSFTESDLEKIEEEMKKVIKENHPFKRKEMTIAEAKKFFKEMGEDYKLELLDEIKDKTVSIYDTGDFTDLCRGPHVNYSKKIKAVKLLKIAGAYWRGNEKNKMLQRIYGVSFPSKEKLEEYLKNIEEAKQRDHRKLGKELDLFSTHEEVGPGLIYWHPKGSVIRKEIEDFWRAEHIKSGYDLLYTPHIAKIDLWEKSGHTGFYKDNMFATMQIDENEYQLKPMNCPFHILIYKNTKRSYRELPLRWAELGTVYRYEKSGVLHGLMRVRGFTQDDAHIFLMEEQLEAELGKLIDFVTYILKTFGFDSYEVYLSTRPEKFVGEPAMWEKSEGALKKALEKSGLSYKIDPGEGVFYGPKIDIKIKDALNRTWQCSTIQVDFNIPERFDVTYVGQDGKEHRTIMIHRALLGSFERFFGVLIEHYKGAFPVWLSPVQVEILTVTDRASAYADEVCQALREKGVRVSVNNDNETIGAKIRNATLQKVPYMLILGDKEAEAKTVSVRKRTGEETKDVKAEDFINDISDKIGKKNLKI